MPNSSISTRQNDTQRTNVRGVASGTGWDRLSSPKIVALFSIAIALGIGWFNLQQGWFPHDEGQLGQAAERVCNGQLPHRDFDDMYTGGLSFLNGLSFHLWGAGSRSMRWMLFLWYIPFVVSVFWLAKRILQTGTDESSNPAPQNLLANWTPGLITILAAAWSIPMYSAPMPSWYNLFFAAWTLCFVLKFMEQGSRKYLLLGGLMVGLSITFKISGLFILAAVLLCLLYRNQTQQRAVDADPTAADKRKLNALSICISIALGGASLVGLAFADQADRLMQTIHLVIPFIALTLFVLWNEWQIQRTGFWKPLKEITWDVLSLGAGVAMPVAALIFVYLRVGALDDFLHGTFVLPKLRFEFASSPFPKFNSFLFTIPLALLLFPRLMGKFYQPRYDKPFSIVAIVISVILFASQNTDLGFVASFMSFRNLGPILVLGNLLLILSRAKKLKPEKTLSLFAITAIAFFASLIQFPFAVSIYFFYAAPLFLVTALATSQFQTVVPRRTLAVVVAFLILFSCSRFHNPLPVISMCAEYQPHPGLPLETSRCKVVVDARLARVFNRLQELVDEHTEVGDTIFSTPDSPETGYMTNRKPFNGVMYEFFHEGLYSDLGQLKRELAQTQVNLVVIKERPEFSDPVSDEFRKVVLADFEVVETVNMQRKSGTVAWFTVYKRSNSDSQQTEALAQSRLN